MTIIPLPHTGPADPEPYYRPLPAAWCYCCGSAAGHPGPEYDCLSGVRPESPERALGRAAFLGLDALALPDVMSNWHPAHVETARRLAGVLLDWAGAAERLTARAAS